MVNGKLMSPVNIILMSIQYFLPFEDAGGNMSALCLVLIIYFSLSIRTVLEVKHAVLTKHRIAVYCIQPQLFLTSRFHLA